MFRVLANIHGSSIFPCSETMRFRHHTEKTSASYRSRSVQSCLIPTPAGKAGTPCYMAVKSIPRPELLASLVSKLGKCHRCDLTVAVVIPLQGQLQLVHVLGAGASGFLQTIRIILDSHLYGVVRILDGIGAVGVPSVVWALTALHGICPPAYRQHHPPLDSFCVWSENQSYGCSLPTSPSSINFWREPFFCLPANPVPIHRRM